MLAIPTVDSLILRGLLGALVAGTVAAAARRAGSLTSGGQWAAFVLGTITALAGWGWAALLIGYFVVSTAITRLGAAKKAARTSPILPEARARDAVQVGANGGLFAALALLGALFDSMPLDLAAVGALAAAAADTWATEIGTLWGSAPRSIVTAASLPPGMSGGITLVGTAASVVGALLVAIPGAALSMAVDDLARGIGYLTVAGVAGCVADSLLGATIQSKRWCAQCRTWTERRVHTCQYRTQHARGVRWMTNDTVNLFATVVGASTALAMVALAP